MNEIRQLGRTYLTSIKQLSASDVLSFALPIGQPVSAFLRPIPTLENKLDATDVELLTLWRNRHVKSFLTEFTATTERTSAWLQQFVHPNEGKILFMLVDLEGRRLGHIGLAFIDWERGYGEADAIVSGGDSPPGLMKLALQTCLKWARDQLGLEVLGVRVRSDNPALQFYLKVGFEEVKRVPLGKKNADEMIVWYEDPDIQGDVPSLVHMIYRW
jgi:RimJ/RimL family protein N-acetyltransferase